MTKVVIFDMYETLITHYGCPLYFGAQMANDIGIAENDFQRIWRPSEEKRTIGKMTLEDALEKIMIQNNCFSKEVLHYVVDKRVETKRNLFEHLHKEIIPMLQGLKQQGIRIGLISNCFSEEVGVIRESCLFPYFDTALFSYEQGIQKPEHEIYRRCMDMLGVEASECLYVGDGGSDELEAASALGMKAVQAVWYFDEEKMQSKAVNRKFKQVIQPLDILQEISKGLEGRSTWTDTQK